MSWVARGEYPAPVIAAVLGRIMLYLGIWIKYWSSEHHKQMWKHRRDPSIFLYRVSWLRLAVCGPVGSALEDPTVAPSDWLRGHLWAADGEQTDIQSWWLYVSERRQSHLSLMYLELEVSITPRLGTSCWADDEGWRGKWGWRSPWVWWWMLDILIEWEPAQDIGLLLTIVVFGKQQRLPRLCAVKFMGHVMWTEELGLETSRTGQSPDAQGEEIMVTAT